MFQGKWKTCSAVCYRHSTRTYRGIYCNMSFMMSFSFLDLCLYQDYYMPEKEISVYNVIHLVVCLPVVSVSALYLLNICVYIAPQLGCSCFFLCISQILEVILCSWILNMVIPEIIHILIVLVFTGGIGESIWTSWQCCSC
jgi:hypothetical protein